MTLLSTGSVALTDQQITAQTIRTRLDTAERIRELLSGEAGIVATTATEEPSGEPEAQQRAEEPAEASRRRARRIAQPEPAPDDGNEPSAAGPPPADIPGEEAAKEELF